MRNRVESSRMLDEVRGRGRRMLGSVLEGRERHGGGASSSQPGWAGRARVSVFLPETLNVP